MEIQYYFESYPNHTQFTKHFTVIIRTELELMMRIL